MKFFLDTADTEIIKKYHAYGMVDGVTTNPSLIVKSGRDIIEVLTDITTIIDGSVSAEVIATDAPTMLQEAEKLLKIAENITIKVPLTQDGLLCCKALASQGIDVNVTLCFSAMQALLAAKAGARYISPFVGRLDDVHIQGMDLIADIKVIYDNYGFNTNILVASVRHVTHVAQAAHIGADVVTMPPTLLDTLYTHPLTDKGLQAFLNEWKQSSNVL